MNRDWILFHLNEAMEELQRTIQDLHRRDYTERQFRIAMEHAYNHVNTAWNSRIVRDRRIRNLTDEDFYRWRQFPKDIDLSAGENPDRLLKKKSK